MKRIFHACLLLAAVAVLGGCGKPAAERLRREIASPGGPSLEQAFAELLADAAWDELDVEPLRLVRVRGTLRGTDFPLEVCYEKKARPARVAFFKFRGRQFAGERFRDFLLWAILTQELPPAPPPAAAPLPVEMP
jgi:hypothetical protein